MIKPDDIPGVEEDVARRIIVAALSIAPCIDSFADDSEAKKNALAILRGVAKEAPEPGTRRVRGQRVGSAGVDYWDAETWLPQDRADLRSLCAAATTLGLPRGSFPTDRPISRMWPEVY